ncbi:MAG: MBL fold metallo-hydrolase [Candidatus Aegiribacteria sp.]
MLIQRIESPGLAHYSYIIGHGPEAVVIDPRRDCGVYAEIARRNRMSVRHILETHRNEDYVVGSLELAGLTGAEIWHADAELDYSYGSPAEDGQTWEVGPLKLKAISTPGHTPGSMSYLLHDQEGHPWICFTGDALFAGDAGRVDLMGMDSAEEMAGMLYDSIFGRLLSLGDGVIVCPAHGPGSVCGSGITGRTMTTMGIERNHNPRLRHDSRHDFIKTMVKELERPPYFRTMEKLNMEGPPVLGGFRMPRALQAAEFHDRMGASRILDTRPEVCFASAHIPGALSVWDGGVAGFAGWYLPYDKPLLLVTGDDPEGTVRTLIRMGYDNIGGYLAGGMLSWHMAGLPSSSTGTLSVSKLCAILDGEGEPFILDVRSSEELEGDGRIPGALHIHITQLPENFREVPDDRPVHIFCGSGNRSMVAASYLQQKGYENVRVILGGLAGWNSASCTIELREEE